MYNSPYYSYNAPLNQQFTKERIDNQIAELQKIKEQMGQQSIQQPQMQPITQNFQLAPTNSGLIKYVNSSEDVNRELVFGDTPFFAKDLSTLWIKNAKGEIKSYQLTEVVQKDEKDLIIEDLQAQINDLKKEMVNNEQYSREYVKQSSEQYDEPVTEPTESKKPTSIQSIRGIKKK